MIGIYKITNKINQKSYIGRSVNIEKRWRDHKASSSYLDSAKYHYPLSQAFRKYGFDNFSFEVLEECSEEQLHELEVYYYKQHSPEYCLTAPNEHFSQNVETRKKISTALTGRKLTKEHIENLVLANSGPKHHAARGVLGVHIKTKEQVSFGSNTEAAQYLIDKGLTTTSQRIASQGIWKVISGRRKTYLGYIWSIP